MSDLTKEINELKNDVSELMDPPASNVFDDGAHCVLHQLHKTLGLLERLSKRVDELERKIPWQDLETAATILAVTAVMDEKERIEKCT